LSTIKVNNIQSRTGNAISFTSGDTITIPSGATLTNNGTATGFGGGKDLVPKQIHRLLH
jgi:uncharacterized protein YjlB